MLSLLNKSILLSLFFLASCAVTVQRPKMEMALAKSAYHSAKKSSAAKYASGKFRKAELSYFKARSLYKKKIFNKAKKFAKITVYYAERAEFESLKRQAFENETIDEFE